MKWFEREVQAFKIVIYFHRPLKGVTILKLIALFTTVVHDPRCTL